MSSRDDGIPLCYHAFVIPSEAMGSRCATTYKRLHRKNKIKLIELENPNWEDLSEDLI